MYASANLIPDAPNERYCREVGRGYGYISAASRSGKEGGTSDRGVSVSVTCFGYCFGKFLIEKLLIIFIVVFVL